MAAPVYGHDLTDWIADSDTTAWGELVNAISGGAPDEADTESALQATNSCSQSCNTTGLCSMCRILGSPVTLSSGQVFLVWHGHGVATAMLSYASGGLRLAVAGSTLTDWKAWAVGGNDVPPFPYSKWVNNPIDPTLTAEYTNGTPPTGGTNIYGVGSMCQLSAAVAKGQPHIVDIIRYGRAEARFNAGDSGTPATFTGFATSNDAQTARWGLIQAVAGGFQWKGLMTLGYSATAVYMTDSNKTIFIQDCRKVSSTFNKIEVRVATSVINWTNMTFNNVAPSTNASKGDFAMIDAADVNIESCSFIDMGTFVFLSSAAINKSLFLRCGQVTHGGADFDSCIFSGYEGTADTGYLVYNVNADPDGEIDKCSFAKGTASTHAIQFGTNTPNTITLRGIVFSGYNASNGNTDSTLYFPDKGSDTTWTVNLVECSGNISYKKARSGDTVNLVINPVTIGITVKDLITGNAITSQDVRVFVSVASGVNYPYNASVTITNSGTTATVAHTGHGLVTNDKVWIKGASHYQNNGVFTITKITDNSYSYTMSSAPGSDPTGTITSTFVPLEGLTNSSGYISASKSYSSDQPVTGWARKSSGTPLYKTGAISGDIDNVAGVQLTVLLAKDE